MNKEAALFKPEEVTVTLGGKEYMLIYDLNAFCELEKIYDSIDALLRMLLGGAELPTFEKVTYNDEVVEHETIKVDGVPLIDLLQKLEQLSKTDAEKQAKHTDTRNLLWAGILHNHSEYNEDGDIVRYTITKSQVGSMVTFKNLRDINSKIIFAILRDLIPPSVEGDEEQKNVSTPERITLAPPTVKH